MEVRLILSLHHKFSSYFTTRCEGYKIEHQPQLNTALKRIVDAWQHVACIPAPAATRVVHVSPFPAYTMHNIMQMHGTEKNKPTITKIMEAMPIRDRDKIMRIEYCTRGPTNHVWYHYRYGRLLSNHFGKILYSIRVKRDPTRDLVNLILGNHAVRNVRALRYTKESESRAIAYYENVTGLRVHDCGLYVSKNGMLATSPDGSVSATRIIHIKSPFNIRMEGVQLAAQPEAGYFITIFNDQYVLNLDQVIGLDYYHQIQGSLYITGAQTCDLIVYTLRDSCIITVHKDPAWRDNLRLLKDFFMERFLPRILDRARLAEKRRHELYT